MEQCSSEEWCVIARPRSKPDVAPCLACCVELREIHAGRNVTNYVIKQHAMRRYYCINGFISSSATVIAVEQVCCNLSLRAVVLVRMWNVDGTVNIILIKFAIEYVYCRTVASCMYSLE